MSAELRPFVYLSINQLYSSRDFHCTSLRGVLLNDFTYAKPSELLLLLGSLSSTVNAKAGVGMYVTI